MSFSSIRISRREVIVLVEIGHPPVNALHPDVAEELLAAVEAAATDPAVRALVLTGTGRFFVAGGDIRFFQSLGRDRAEAYALRIQHMQNTIHALRVPVIAAVNGITLGGGCELMMACDIRIADPGAVFGLPEVTLGVIPGAGGTQMLPRLVSPGTAKRLLFTGERISAHEALAIGLVDEVTKPGGVLDTALGLAERIAANAPLAVARAKAAANLALELPLSEGLRREAGLFGELFDTADVREGVAAFLDRRPADFQGR